jgi:TPR repeat protein
MRLGFMNEKGLGTDPSSQIALNYYEKAARNGSVEAQRAMERLGAATTTNN